MNARSDANHPNPDHSRKQIVSAAHRLFLEQGFHGTTMRQISKESGMALGSLYTYFPGKDELFKAVFDAYNPYLILLLALENTQGNSAEELVRTSARRLVTALSARPDLIKLTFIDVVEFQGKHLQAAYPEVSARLESFTMRIKRNPAAVKNFSAESLLRAFFGLFYSFHMNEMLLGKPPDPSAQSAALQDSIEIYLRGILV
ncbi:MAG: TetR/AcrR family transcriptional regulator [Clostridiaceae bacterium]